MSAVKVSIDLKMHAPGLLVKVERELGETPTFLITADSEGIHLMLAVETFGILRTATDIAELGNLLEVLGHELIKRSTESHAVMEPVDG